MSARQGCNLENFYVFQRKIFSHSQSKKITRAQFSHYCTVVDFAQKLVICNVHARYVEQVVEAECVWPSSLFVSQFLSERKTAR
jgi:hypothetical protein